MRRPWAPDVPRLKALIEEGKTYAECAAILGRTRCSVENAAERYRIGALRKWTAEEMRELVQRRMEAQTFTAIAAELKRTPRGVEGKWRSIARHLPEHIVARVRADVRGNCGRKPRA